MKVLEKGRRARAADLRRVSALAVLMVAAWPPPSGSTAPQAPGNQPPQVVGFTIDPNPFFGNARLDVAIQVADPNGLSDILGVYLGFVPPSGGLQGPLPVPQLSPGQFGFGLTIPNLPYGPWQLIAGVVDQSGLFALSGWNTLLSAVPPTTPIGFELSHPDDDYGPDGVGWIRAADVVPGGPIELVAGGGDRLYVYRRDLERDDWTRFGNLDSTSLIGANGGELHDVDQDGDLDVVSAIYYDDLGWWENPGAPLTSAPWTFHALYQQPAATSFYVHDVIRVDLDQDGDAEEFLFNLIGGSDLKIEWFRPTGNPLAPWERHVVEPLRDHGNNNHAGLDVGDLDGDGDLDIAYSNGWYESPGNPTGTWTWHLVTNVANVSNALFRDMDGDGDLDLVTSSGHGGTEVLWHENDGTPATGPWTAHPIGTVTNPEGLVVEDIDHDGDLDVIASELFFASWSQQVHNVYLFRNGGNALSWMQANIAPNSWPSHLLQGMDLDGDGMLDLISGGAGFGVVSHFENTTP